MSDNEYSAISSAPHLRAQLQRVRSAFDQFYIQINLQLLNQSTLSRVDGNDENKEEDFVVVNCGNSSQEKITKSINGHLWARCNRLERDNLPWPIISKKLSEMGVPLQKQPFMLHQIAKFADEIMNDEQNKNQKILPMAFSASVVVNQPAHNSIGPASKEAIEGLRKEKVDNGWVHANECGVCMDGFAGDCNLNVMPCNHIFHGDCIVKWLGVSSLCPICLYQLPV